MNVFVLHAHQVESQWSWIRGFLERIETPLWAPEDVLAALLTEAAQLWGFNDINGKPLGIVVTKIGHIGNTPSGLIWAASGGGIEMFVELLHEHIEPWMRSKGCRVIEIVGRKGWERSLKHEYSAVATLFAKDLRDGKETAAPLFLKKAADGACRI